MKMVIITTKALLIKVKVRKNLRLKIKKYEILRLKFSKYKIKITTECYKTTTLEVQQFCY